MDPDFQHAVKVRAEFDWVMERSAENVRGLGARKEQALASDHVGR